MLGSDRSASPSITAITAPSSSHIGNTFINLYYEYFHPSHPFLLPQKALQARIDGADGSTSLGSLVLVVEHVGSYYQNSLSRTLGLRGDLLDGDAPIDGFMVQAMLLMSLAESMCSNENNAERWLQHAMARGRLLGMHRKEFADLASIYDPVLAESWRRTWWMICLTDANYSITRRDYTLSSDSSENTTDLPCEDDDYKRMVCAVFLAANIQCVAYNTLKTIPQCTTSMMEYKNREYALEEKLFSSFAYLIDASRIFVMSLRSAVYYQNYSKAEQECEDLEAHVVSWFLMLPPSKRELPVKPAKMDQLLFQAHMMMYTYVLQFHTLLHCPFLRVSRSMTYIHRPLSNLRYDPVEGMSTCGSAPPPLRPELGCGPVSGYQEHAEKLFSALRKQNQCLILLPMRAAQLSPFVLCMVACCTIAYLVGCKGSFGTEETEIARCRIRVSMGTLKHYEDIWPRARKILNELKLIARSVLEGVSPTPAADVELLAGQDALFASFFDKNWLQAFGTSTY